METYLVGGAVRDELLGLEVNERDWVVVGGSGQQMLELGYRKVGRDFPVFLHPDSGDEYALARTERKRGRGYTGFDCDSSPTITLEDDLLRRDLTINAMARSTDRELIDPYHGRRDLEARLLRHVSPAFVEDPLRVLRVARFAARFHQLGFRVADETLTLMQQLSRNGELDELVAERVWQEARRALITDSPQVFVSVLRDCGALGVLFPEVDRLFGIPQTEKYHPEIDTGIHILLCLQLAARLQTSENVRVALLLHDLGKASTPHHNLPSHVGHEQRGLPLVRGFAERLKLPRAQRELAELVCRHHLRCHQATQMKAPTLVSLLEDLDAWRKPQRFEEFLTACEIDARGRTGLEQRDYQPAALLRQLQTTLAEISGRTWQQQGLTGEAISRAVHQARTERVATLLPELRRET